MHQTLHGVEENRFREKMTAYLSISDLNLCQRFFFTEHTFKWISVDGLGKWMRSTLAPYKSEFVDSTELFIFEFQILVNIGINDL